MTSSSPPDPFDRLATWLEEAKEGEINDPGAFYIASVGQGGQPSVRTVLLKALNADGLVFYTNLRSRKGQELLTHPKAAALFHWKSLERQVRVEGPVTQVSDAEADAYFARRPRGSQIGAHASKQSQPLASDQQLLDRLDALNVRYADQQIPRPDHWSGLRLIPNRFEFWQAGAHRLHRREVLSRTEAGWTDLRLFP